MVTVFMSFNNSYNYSFVYLFIHLLWNFYYIGIKVHSQVITIHLRANWIESLEYWLRKIKVVNLIL